MGEGASEPRGHDAGSVAGEVPGRWRFRVGPVPVVVQCAPVGFLWPLAVSAALMSLPAAAGAPPWLVSLADYTGVGVLVGTLVGWMPHEAAHALAARWRGVRAEALVVTRSAPGVELPEEFWSWPRRARAPVLLAGPATDLAISALLITVAWLAATRVALEAAVLLGGVAFYVAVAMVASLIPIPDMDMHKLTRGAARRR